MDVKGVVGVQDAVPKQSDTSTTTTASTATTTLTLTNRSTGDGDGKDDLLVFLARETEGAKPKPAVIFGPLTSEPVMVSDLGLDIVGANPMGDLDGDGLADLAIDWTKDGNGRVVVLAGRADRTLVPLYQIELGPVKSDERVQLGAGDLDADGTRDLVLLHLKNRDNRLLIFLQPFASEETPHDHAP